MATLATLSRTEKIQLFKDLIKDLKPRTATNYSRKKKLNRRTVYNMAHDKRLLNTKVDGVLFIIP